MLRSLAGCYQGWVDQGYPETLCRERYQNQGFQGRKWDMTETARPEQPVGISFDSWLQLLLVERLGHVHAALNL